MTLLLALPILIPLVTASIAFLLRGHLRMQRILGLTGAFLHLAASIALLARVQGGDILVLQAGGWSAPFGISLVADILSGIMVALTGIMGAAIAVYSLTTMDPDREAYGYYPLLHILIMGVSGAFLTGDVFNLFVWFEVLLIASFVLLAFGGERGQMEGALKYVTINLVASALFLAAVGILYGVAGTLNMADLAVKLRDVEQPGLITTIGMLFLVAFGIKAAVFPLFFWLPASYHTPPIAISAIFAGLLTKVGVYALIRFFTLIFTHEVAYTHGIILAVAGLTMITGVLGAASQNDMRRILSFHIISQIGYMVMGLALFTPLAVAGSVFYLGHHIIVKTNLFLVAGVAKELRGSYELKHTGGLYRVFPWLGVLFLIPALSLAGVPPLSGFWAKLLLVKAGLDVQSYLIVGVALLVGVLTLFSMTKIWAEAFWKAEPEGVTTAASGARVTMVAPIVALAALTVIIGLMAQPLLEVSMRAADQLLDPSQYIAAVLGVQP